MLYCLLKFDWNYNLLTNFHFLILKINNISFNNLMAKETHLLLFISLLLITTYSQYCLLPNCLSCPTNPYTCTNCPTGSQCCQSSCTNCLSQTQCAACSSGYSLNQVNNVCQLSNSCSQGACTNCFNNYCSACSATYIINTYTY